MPLNPVDTEGRRIPDAELSPGARAAWVRECLREQQDNANTGRGIDSVALARAEALAVGDDVLVAEVDNVTAAIAEAQRVRSRA